MELNLFKLDIDELINGFSQDGAIMFSEFKRVWLLRKFSYIFEASPTTNQGCFMQSLYAHCIGYMVAAPSLSHRVGGLYCLYCLYETQPFKPPFRIYLSLGELKRLKDLIADTKTMDTKVVSAVVKRMLERNMFLFGFVDTGEGSAAKRVNELTDIQNARVQTAWKKLFANTRLEQFIHMDLGKELDVDLIKKKSTEYAAAKELAIREAHEMIDVQNVKHIAENKELIGDTVAKTAADWNSQKELFYQQTGFNPQAAGTAEKGNEEHSNWELVRHSDNENLQDKEEKDGFSKELEEVLLSEPSEYDNEETQDIEH